MAALRAPQPVFASNLRDGTAAGAAILAFMTGSGEVPQIALDLTAVRPAETAGLEAYRKRWRQLAGT
jgi:hypothetical protein